MTSFGNAEFDTVDDVLPQDICRGCDTCQRIQEVLSHPNSEDGILLTQQLAALDSAAETFADLPADKVLRNGDNQRYKSQNNVLYNIISTSLDDIIDGRGHGERQREEPDIEGVAFEFIYLHRQIERHLAQDERNNKRQQQNRHNTSQYSHEQSKE